MNIVLCECAEKRAYTAGNKARTDTVQILLKNRYNHVPLYISKSNRVKVLFDMILGLVKTISMAGKDDNVFIQYPYYPFVVNKVVVNILCFGRIFKHYNIEMLIHDVISLRSEINADVSKEVKLFNKIDKVICHNEVMKEIFKRNGCIVECAVLGPFDYLYNGDPVDTAYSNHPTVIIAGNLAKEKCGYVYKLNKIKNCKFALYGINYSSEMSENVFYKGSFPPEELIKNLEGNFGLVWDGESIDSCVGIYGRYLKYNSPHKFSLYIAAGIPLIVWSESALAPYVKKYNLGICVKSLKELEKLSLTEEEYGKICKSVSKYRIKIVNGEHLKGVLNREG